MSTISSPKPPWSPCNVTLVVISKFLWNLPACFTDRTYTWLWAALCPRARIPPSPGWPPCRWSPCRCRTSWGCTWSCWSSPKGSPADGSEGAENRKVLCWSLMCPGYAIKSPNCSVSEINPVGPQHEKLNHHSTFTILLLNHDCIILRQSSNPVCFSWKNQASYRWANQHRAYSVPSWRNHIQGWMIVWIFYCHALEKGCLFHPPWRIVRRRRRGPCTRWPLPPALIPSTGTPARTPRPPGRTPACSVSPPSLDALQPYYRSTKSVHILTHTVVTPSTQNWTLVTVHSGASPSFVMFSFVFFLKFWLPIGLHNSCSISPTADGTFKKYIRNAPECTSTFNEARFQLLGEYSIFKRAMNTRGCSISKHKGVVSCFGFLSLHSGEKRVKKPTLRIPSVISWISCWSSRRQSNIYCEIFQKKFKVSAILFGNSRRHYSPLSLWGGAVRSH